MATHDTFTADDLYDPEIIQEAHHVGLALEGVIDAVPRFEISVLIALVSRFVDICEQADIDPSDAFSQIADGVLAEQFIPETDAIIHIGNNSKH